MRIWNEITFLWILLSLNCICIAFSNCEYSWYIYISSCLKHFEINFSFKIKLKITLSLPLKLFCRNKIKKTFELLPLNIKSINPIQIYIYIYIYIYIFTHYLIIGLFSINICCISIVLLPVNFLISFGLYSTPKLSKYVTLLPFHL